MSTTLPIPAGAMIAASAASVAGVTLADTPGAFDDLVRTFALLDGRPAMGRRLGALSNAGSECVTIADHAGALDLPRFTPSTEAALAAIMAPAGIGSVVDIRNPLDLTPIADDAVTATAVRTVLLADEVDVGIVGLVPMADTLQTLPSGPGHDEDMDGPEAIAARLADLWHATSKPWVVVVDAGAVYDPWVARLRAHGLPVLGTADAATRVLDAWCEATIGRTPRS
jgi:acyl-CoA synthetase (NDP forming)